MTNDNSEFQNEVIKQLSQLANEVRDLKLKLSDATLNADIRNLLQYSPLEIEMGEMRTTKFDRRSMELIFEAELPKLKHILPLVMGTIDTSDSSGERAGPNDFSKVRNGYFRTMLMRYIATSRIFAQDKKVLDCCCGRGWGSVILSHYAKEIDAIDLDEDVIKENRNYWRDFDIDWKVGSVLENSHFTPEGYDTVFGMEIIEHFTKDEGNDLFDNILNSLRPGGFFVGTSVYPNNRIQADNHASLKIEGHKFLWTVPELRERLNPHCESVAVHDNWMLIFQKSK